MQTYYVNGNFVPADQAVIPVDDLAILRGIGVFDLLRTYNGKPLFLKEHVDRLLNSVREINLAVPWSHEHIVETVLETLKRNSVDEANIRIIITGGSSPDFITPAGKPRLIILVTPLPKLPQWWHEKGVKVITMRSARRIPGAKSIDYLPASIALREAESRNAIEVIYLDADDNALEGTTSNLFAFYGDTLATPGEGVLSGITRKAVLEIARSRYTVALRTLPRKELLAADEVFITGTNKGLVPVVTIDDTTIGDGAPGHRTRAIMAALKAHTEAKLKA